MRRPALAVVAVLPLAALATTSVATAAPVATAATSAGRDHHIAGTRAALESSNWSGYGESGQFTAISGSWTVPSVTGTTSASAGRTIGALRRDAAPGRHTPPAAARGRRPSPRPRPGSSSESFSSAWLGIDGLNNSDLIQTGTEQDFYDGSAHYNAWWEVLPAAETPISEPVSPGDRITASITEAATRSWTITLSDQTQGWTFTKTIAYTGPGTSAEWIMEAPEVNGAIAPLADYSFPSSAATAGDFNTLETSSTVGGALSPAGITTSGQIELVQNGQIVSIPSGPDPARDAFNVANSSTAPAAPTE